MICVSLIDLTYEQCLVAISDLDFVEIRLDRIDVDLQKVKNLFSTDARTIATCRPGRIPDDERRQLLKAAIHSGANYVDIELDADATYRESLILHARKNDCKVIISHHDYQGTPPVDELHRLVENIFSLGADIAKIACKADSARDNARLLGLLDGDRAVIVIGMGPVGKITRVTAPLLGSPFTYCSLTEDRPAAEGQLDIKATEGLLEKLKNV